MLQVSLPSSLQCVELIYEFGILIPIREGLLVAISNARCQHPEVALPRAILWAGKLSEISVRLPDGTTLDYKPKSLPMSSIVPQLAINGDGDDELESGHPDTNTVLHLRVVVCAMSQSGPATQGIDTYAHA